eukprot:CAMPEP_0116900538 /NCGR_PEP_ID=MMETSP0467-20121206/8778_1 /TAXON_ID=283647 /ORGANISM="Mesodinium pulex, Strain SPMC105" /LENGTH=74 /DNA_ID=CAMNT_0004573801 /DNA_START=567 /DNA_END=791 /DNA_ORIENTATION=-
MGIIARFAFLPIAGGETDIVIVEIVEIVEGVDVACRVDFAEVQPEFGVALLLLGVLLEVMPEGVHEDLLVLILI